MKDAADPNYGDIREMYANWQQSVMYGYDTASREYREMYLALLARHDAKNARAGY